MTMETEIFTSGPIYNQRTMPCKGTRRAARVVTRFPAPFGFGYCPSIRMIEDERGH